MHYAVSDIHGCYEKFLSLLERISFSSADTLFFLGDAADRGPDGILVMQDLMRRENAVCLLGNHEDMFRTAARDVGKKLKGEAARRYQYSFSNWTGRNGGEVTWEAYRKLPEAEQQALLAWMEQLPTCYEIALNGRAFLLAHAGVGDYVPEKDLTECSLFDFIWERMSYEKTYYRDKYLVTGHTPTLFIHPSFSGKILQKNHHIAIDCGAVYTGVLGCVCLETLEEYYVQ